MKKTTSDREAYLTKRALERISSKAGKKASARAMRVAGYVVKAQDGWIVQENKDGSIERLSHYAPKIPSKLILD